MGIWNVMLSLVALCLLANCDTVSVTAPDAVSETVPTSKLSGAWPTCLEPENIEKAEAAAERGNFGAWWVLKCGGMNFNKTQVRVIRCAANLIPVQMKRFSDPVPLDDGIPDDICEVELFFQEGGAEIAYTHFLNIERSP